MERERELDPHGLYNLGGNGQFFAIYFCQGYRSSNGSSDLASSGTWRDFSCLSCLCQIKLGATDESQLARINFMCAVQESKI